MFFEEFFSREDNSRKMAKIFSREDNARSSGHYRVHFLHIRFPGVGYIDNCPLRNIFWRSYENKRIKQKKISCLDLKRFETAKHTKG